jgi:hypothetical protein
LRYVFTSYSYLVVLLMSTRKVWIARLVVGLAMLATTSCHRATSAADASNLLAFNDYEAVMGWMSGTESITRERAHSGSRAVQVGGSIEYGLGYGLELSQVADHPLRKLHLEAWGYMTDPQSTAQLGLQLYDPAQRKAIFSQGIDYAVAVQTPGKWVKISQDITLPDSTNGAQQLRVFLWRASASSPAYLDDLRISEVRQ